jgi:hypothetical protein
MKKILLGFVIIVVAAALLLRWQLGRGARATAADDTRPVPSAALADSADARLQTLKNGQVESVVLRAVELQSLLEYRFLQLMPAFVSGLTVELEEGRIEVQARVPVDRLPSISELGEAAGFLPDTTEVELIGEILPLDSGRVALSIDRVSAARIPLPQRLVPRALQQLGRKDEPGLPADALAVPLPPGAAAAYVRGDALVLQAQPIPRPQN